MNRDCSCRKEPSIHAEHHAIQKLPAAHRKPRHLKKLDILVIRVNRGGSLGNSKPCLRCLLMLSQRLPEKGYCINKVYYSNDQGEIRAATIHALLNDDSPHISKYYQK